MGSSTQQLDRLGAQRTCHLLGNRSVIFLGDSVTEQAATMVMNALRPTTCAPQILHVLSDTLTRKTYGHTKRGPGVRIVMVQDQPDILIFGTGAHIYGEENFINVFARHCRTCKATRDRIQTFDSRTRRNNREDARTMWTFPAPWRLSCR